MQIHKFIKAAGAKALEAEADRAREAREYIAGILGTDDDIEDLRVDIVDGQIKLSGRCRSQSALERAILLAGNITGISEVVSDGLEMLEKGVEKIKESRFYTIKSGDTLSKVAKEFYGDASRYPDIVEANRGIIENADRIYPGQTIRIP